MTTLKEAQKSEKAMKQFVTEHKDDVVESEQFEQVLSSMTGKPKEVQEA